MSAIQERKRIRHLVDLLPENDLPVAERVLRGLIGESDPVLRALVNAREDDEPTSDEEEAAVQEALAELAAGDTSSTHDLMRRLGL